MRNLFTLKLMLISLLTAMSMVAKADYIEFKTKDGLCYGIDTDAKCATLSKYEGAATKVVIPKSVVYKGVAYDVTSLDDVAGLLSLFEKPDTAKLVREVAIALMGGHYVSIPCAGGGSVSSETGWDGRKKDEEDENFRLRCWLHAAKTVKDSRKAQTKQKGHCR